MQQTFRRQLLALGRLGDSQEQVDGRCQQFIHSVLATAVDRRPDTEAVRDVLLSNQVATPVVARFIDTFDAAVWGGAR